MWKKLLLFPHNVYTFEKLKLFLLREFNIQLYN